MLPCPRNGKLPGLYYIYNRKICVVWFPRKWSYRVYISHVYSTGFFFFPNFAIAMATWITSQQAQNKSVCMVSHFIHLQWWHFHLPPGLNGKISKLIYLTWGAHIFKSVNRYCRLVFFCLFFFHFSVKNISFFRANA